MFTNTYVLELDLHHALGDIHLLRTIEHMVELTRKGVCRLSRWKTPSTPVSHLPLPITMQWNALTKTKIAVTPQSEPLRIRANMGP